MKYDLSIRDHNKQPHIDIEKDIKKRGNGALTFSIRINDGDIVDYAPIEYVDAKAKYLSLKSITIQQFDISYPTRERGTGNPIRRDNVQRPTAQR